MNVHERPSPNFNERPAGVSPSLVVLHYTGMPTAEDALARLCDADAKVSAHYVIEENGAVWNLVPEDKRAWHAGVSYWQGYEGVNDISIGIEIVNPGHEWGYRPFPEEQIAALTVLLADIHNRYSLKPWAVVGHSDVAPERKEDPGEYFPWQTLAEKGLGTWPRVAPPASGGKIIARSGDVRDYLKLVQKRLQEFGYRIEPTGIFDPQMEKVVMAFRRRFLPRQLEPVWDEAAELILNDLMRHI